MRLQAHDSGKGFTLVELLVVLVIVIVLGVALFPALANTTDHTRRVQCADNMRQIAVGLVSYTGEYNEFMPALKWRDANQQYPYEMFRYDNINMLPPSFDIFGGPYNLGMLWNSGTLKDGRIFYCPSRPDSNRDILTYQFYNQKTNWPSGGDPARSNPGYVRSGYFYYPQSKTAKVENGSDAPVSNPVIPFWPAYNTSGNPLSSWVCVPPFTMSDMNTSKSMLTDDIQSGLPGLSHNGGSIQAGLNAVFPDGHVKWQSVRGNPAIYDLSLWQIIGDGTSTHGLDVRYLLSALQN